MDPLAVYIEKKGLRRRKFELHNDRLLMQVSDRFGVNAEMNFDLSTFDPERDRFWIKDPIFEKRLTFLLIIMIGLTLCSVWIATFFLKPWIPILPGAAIAIVVFTLSFHNKRVEYSRFKSPLSTQSFDIGPLGNSQESYRAFVEMLIERIKRCKAEKARQ